MNATTHSEDTDPMLLDPARLDRSDTDVRSEPFPFMIAHGQLPDDARSDLERDFPQYTSAGFFPYDASDCGPSVNELVEQMSSPAFAAAIGRHLGIENLGQYPTLITLCKLLNRRHGTIHTDSKSKVATALIYLNQQWPDTSDGCLRFLRGIDNIDDIVAPELKPLFGEFAVFRRTENSFHGHLPYEGERRVIQVAWLTSEEEKLRKTKRGKFSRVFKKIFGKWDRRLGAGRDRSASHKD
ncbi:2-oxoglutarate-Fe(II)-dependent oxygenase superfamily protein [Luteibacter rhizovicinus]|uniref:2-oxoglutarate-Fe(II)-dependent oxygenase superfamily protein n=1 Tax=Luteibacter rhizovicinus TaxID=242606 RepID=A0A4R3YG91_9GAMM|nr:2OG-Fe(II) oxygenase [Luteibacter rhizovicinus]TCV91160.1 2-oxoglutarate-Fe(II)-dependent oxygenase superfamily protein [Luteibacter rhizovicinus]